MTMVDCIALALTFAAIWLAAELWWACKRGQRRNRK